MGELLAWIIGWDLVLEYAVGAATVSVSWSEVLDTASRDFRNLPPRGVHQIAIRSGIVNLPAIFIICAISIVLIIGISESARFNGFIVALKVTIVILVIGLGFAYVNRANYTPFIPPNTGEFGHFRLVRHYAAAGVIFFAYIGFDAVSTAAQETKNPQRDMPIGIIGSLAVCTLLYVGFSYVLSGIVNYKTMTDTAIYEALHNIGYDWLGTGVVIGILAAYTLRHPRHASRDRAASSIRCPAMDCSPNCSPTFTEIQNPWRCNLAFMVFVSLFSGLVPLSSLGDMTSIGTLLAFVIVCGGVMIMRRTNPDLPGHTGHRLSPWCRFSALLYASP